MAMMISWVMPVNPSHPYLENDPAPSFAPTICAFHLGFSLGRAEEIRTERKQHRRDRWFAVELNVFSLVFGTVLGAVVTWGFPHLLM